MIGCRVRHDAWGRAAQRESTPFTREGSQVRSLSRPPLSFNEIQVFLSDRKIHSASAGRTERENARRSVQNPCSMFGCCSTHPRVLRRRSVVSTGTLACPPYPRIVASVTDASPRPMVRPHHGTTKTPRATSIGWFIFHLSAFTNGSSGALEAASLSPETWPESCFAPTITIERHS
jgi:hypothetical protein